MSLTATITNSSFIGVGFGTAGLGNACSHAVSMALDAGFRKFDTAEADYWYDQKAVGVALETFLVEQKEQVMDDECIDTDGYQCDSSTITCQTEELKISTKIPPWSLTSVTDIRDNASKSRQELVGFCEDIEMVDAGGNTISVNYPLDVYYIHAPKCWDGWHPRCDDVGSTLELRDAWMAMEAVVGIDHSSERIGLSNVWPNQLMDIIQFVQERQNKEENGHGDNYYPPPRMPDVIQIFADPINPANELRQICQDHDIEFVSYSTLGTQHRSGPNGNPVLGSSVVQNLASRHQRSKAEVVLSWALQKGMSVIPRSSKKNHIQELSNLLVKPPFLTEEDMIAMDSLSQD